MNRLFIICTAGLTQLLSIAPATRAQNNPPLRLVQTIVMPNVKGRIDHMDVDLDGKRLFVAGIENGTMEVLDLSAGKWMRSITGFKTPTEMCYVRDLNKLFVASRDDGMIRVFRGDSLELIDSIKLELLSLA
jgi:sugar lactone lactonase YvrE